MSEIRPAGDPLSRAAYPHWSRVQVRFTDQDTLGHVNNVATALYLEQARCDLVYALTKPLGLAHLDVLVVKVAIEYLAELTYPGTVEVGSRVSRIGSKSFTTTHAIFQGAGAKAAVTGETTMVWFDLPRRATVKPTAELRAGLERLA